MAGLTAMTPILAFLTPWEIIALFSVALIFFGAKRLPELARGLRTAIEEFKKSSDDIWHETGESLGGIYGKRAAQALTPDNHVAELYNPGAFQKPSENLFGRIKHALARFIQRIVRFFRR